MPENPPRDVRRKSFPLQLFRSVDAVCRELPCELADAGHEKTGHPPIGDTIRTNRLLSGGRFRQERREERVSGSELIDLARQEVLVLVTDPVTVAGDAPEEVQFLFLAEDGMVVEHWDGDGIARAH